MTKLRNKIVLVLLALCLAVCAGLFVACGGDTPQDNSVTYTVTVKAGDSAAEGVKVTVKKGSTILGKPVTTGADGKAEFSLAEDAGYTVTLDDLPRGYKVADGAELKFDGRNLTVTLEEKPASYTIKLVNYDNTAYTAAGVLVGICTVESNNCLELVEPDANGIVKIYDATKTDYHIQIKGLPAGYAFESDGTYALQQNAAGRYLDAQLNKEYVSLSATVVEQTIKIYPVNVIKLTDAIKISDAELESDYWYVEGMSAYKMNIAVEANSTVYYEYTADYSGDYYFYSDKPDELICKLNESFLLGDSHLSGNGMFNPPVTLEKGKKYYLNVTNNGDEKVTAETILSTPYATYTTVTGAGTVKAEVNKQDKCAVIELEPTAGSTYKLTVNGNGAVKQTMSANEDCEFEDADYTNGKELTVKYTEEMQGNLYFAVSVKTDSYPAAVDVKIERIGTHTNETVVVKSTVFTQAPAKPEGKELASVASDETLVKGDDGYYHIGSKDGELVMVALTKAFGVNSDGIIYMERWNHKSSSVYVIDVTSVEDQANANKGKSFKDYRLVLRGFNEFNVQQEGLISYTYIIPTDLEEDTYYYANYVNEDGAYPLDDLLKDFLTGFADTLGTDWLFACGYYDVPQDDDPIVGEYSTEDGAFTLTIDNNNQFVIMDVGEGMEYVSGTWSKTGNEYTFIIPNDYFNSVMAYADGEITFSDIFNEDPLTFAKVEADDPIVGEYSTEDGAFTLSIYKSNEFTIMETDVSEYVSGTWSKTDDGYTFTIPNDEFNSVMTYSDGVITFSDDFSEDPLTFIKSQGNDDEVDITGIYKSMMQQATITVYDDGTFVLISAQGVETGLWEKNGKNYKFIAFLDEDNSVEYTVSVKDGVLELFTDPESFPVYTFTLVEEEEDGDPDVADILSEETLLQDPTSSQARLGLWENGKCVLWQNRNGNYVKIATATWDSEQDGNVTISEITVADGYEYEITANYAQGVVTVTLQQEDMDDTVYTFNMPQE
ncbi:MAG: hypothetical protein K2J01_00820 [Clostridiales bacterium]|nr:hypothetical protein [Clostridiales bacterium]